MTQLPHAGPRPALAHGPADQAAGLRHLLGRPALRVLPVMGGGAASGKSAIVLRLAQLVAPLQSVVVLDQSDGEVARQLGVSTRADLQDLLGGHKDFGAVVVRSGALRLVPARRGLTNLMAAGSAGEEFFRGFLRLAEPASLVLVNLDDGETRLPDIVDGGSAEVLLVTTPQAASMTAAYARIKRIGAAAGARCRIRVLVNGATDLAESQRVFRALSGTARDFLDIEPVFAGFLPVEAGGTAFGRAKRPPEPACAAALAQVAASIPTWRLAECALDADPHAPESHLQ
jgi:flagellar biosynthesis protein FlhG